MGQNNPRKIENWKAWREHSMFIHVKQPADATQCSLEVENIPKSDMFEVDAEASTTMQQVVRGPMWLTMNAADRKDKLKRPKCLWVKIIPKYDMFGADADESTNDAEVPATGQRRAQ